MEYIEIAIVIAMILLNAIFAGYEIALASVSVARLQSLATQKRPGAISALAMKEGIEKSLAVVQLGITLVGFIAGATGGASASEALAPLLQSNGFGPWTANVLAICLVVIPLTALTIVVGELMPKLFALRHKEWVCLVLSPIMKFFAISVWPLVWFLENSASGLMDLIERLWTPSHFGDSKTEASEIQELRAIASMARASRLIGAREENIILGAARIAMRPVHEIMLPAEHIRMLSLNENLSDSLLAAHMDLHTRFPVTEVPNDPQRIVGYITFKDLVTALKMSPSEPTIKGIVRSIPSLPNEIPISAALEFLLKERTHIALIIDKSKRILGMITLEDIVEELVGDIQDEHDLLPVHVIRSGNGWIIGGGASLNRVREMTQITLPGEGQQSLSAWVIERIGDNPKGSEVLRQDGLRLIVRKVRRQRVLEVGITPQA